MIAAALSSSCTCIGQVETLGPSTETEVCSDVRFRKGSVNLSPDWPSFSDKTMLQTTVCQQGPVVPWTLESVHTYAVHIWIGAIGAFWPVESRHWQLPVVSIISCRQVFPEQSLGTL